MIGEKEEDIKIITNKEPKKIEKEEDDDEIDADDKLF